MDKELYIVCKKFINYADVLLNNQSISIDTYNEMTRLKLQFIMDYEESHIKNKNHVS